MDYFKQNKAKKLRQQLEAQVSSAQLLWILLHIKRAWKIMKVKLERSFLTCVWLVVFCHFRRVTWCSSVWMPRPSQRTSSPTHSRCRWWPTALAQHCESIHVCSCVRLYLYVCLFLCVCLLLSLSQFRTRGGFVALSPISPQELFLQPISSDIDASQQQVRKRTIISIQLLTPQLRLRAVVPNLFETKHFLLATS